MPATAKRQTARELTEEEWDGLNNAAAAYPDMEADEDGNVTMTEAELLLLEEGGAEVQHPDSKGNFDLEKEDADYGQVMVRVGKGKGKFEVRVLDPTNDKSLVYLWRRDTGVKVPLMRQHLAYYAKKGTFLPRPPAGVTPPELKYRCLASLVPCKKRFSNVLDQRQHFVKAHSTEASMAAVEREQKRSDDMDRLIDKLTSDTGASDSQAGLFAAVQMLREEVSKNWQGPQPIPVDNTAHEVSLEEALEGVKGVDDASGS